VTYPGLSETRILSFDPVSTSSLEVRSLVADFAQQHGLDHVLDAAALCATELATNAILHTRHPFVVTVRCAGHGVRVDVLDSRPDEMPMMTPTGGTALDLTTFGNSGRGLQIVAALAERWGVFATDDAKTVWAEVTGEANQHPGGPTVVLRQSEPDRPGLVRMKFLDLPVRAAVSSGIQVEDVVRDLQLEPAQSPSRHDGIQRLFHLLDRSASIRLVGRHAALTAAAAGATRFDLEIATSIDALKALEELSHLLHDIDTVLSVGVPPLEGNVIAFRKWINEEGARQRNGFDPSPSQLD
jgi:anti-sigma regulatory factor (Ser/Thr protein kinase)